MSKSKTPPAPAAGTPPTPPAAAGAPKAPLGSAVGTLHVKIKRSHPDYAYHPGETGELPAGPATDLIAGGFAEVATLPTDETR